jgi:hypothetical protein
MRAQKSRWSRLWAAAVFALAGAACSSEHLGMNPQGSGGDGSGPCPGSTLCPPLGTGGIVGTGGIKGAGGSGGTVLDAGSICDQIASKYQTALAVARACTPGAANQCQALVGDAPANCPGSECVDELLVNDGSLVESERENWLNAGCGGPPQLCIDITCRLPPAVCVAVPGSTMGTCVPAPSDAGAGPDAAESCEQLGTDYLAAVSAAQTCTPGAPNQCQALADPVLEPCDVGCRPLEPVNDATGVNEALMRWVAKCATGGCPQIACQPPPPPTGICVRAGNAAGTGTCVAAAAGTTN